MSANTMPETTLTKPHPGAPARQVTNCEHPSHLVWKIVGGVVVGLAATALITSLNDIRRYIRIMKM